MRLNFREFFLPVARCPMTDDFFRARLDQMIDLRHPLAVLASRMPWAEIECLVLRCKWPVTV